MTLIEIRTEVLHLTTVKRNAHSCKLLANNLTLSRGVKWVADSPGGCAE